MPIHHAKMLLRGIIDRVYPRDLRFWLYCQRLPFDRELASLMERANVAGISFGTDLRYPSIVEQMVRLR